MSMMSTKRVILADGPRLLREMLRHVIDKADHLEVVQEVADQEQVASAIEEFQPEWVIVTSAFNGNTESRLDSWLSGHPAVRFMFLAAGNRNVTMKGHLLRNEEYADPSLKDFIELLEKDLQRT
jgi:DNA-binding NarL/FixJ family response regulator